LHVVVVLEGVEETKRLLASDSPRATVFLGIMVSCAEATAMPAASSFANRHEIRRVGADPKASPSASNPLRARVDGRHHDLVPRHAPPRRRRSLLALKDPADRSVGAELPPERSKI
jgi:hypothetical protein